ncbi:TRAF3-interacting protein 1 isoform X2 [Bicyclus anynana]|uniref:TRAF3-interacting protein 1 isoform X2 n=1 Tax=Bicyclus anynana TaxID=110368 RepID=A0A6J1N108_BICAN|nr:TRAF3-interacting protein 1 isoform X2 [Bicyclus anynana]
MVLKSTGFFSGLFDEEELISDNVKDRESKILFLNKIITVIGTTTGKSLSVKPSKIIAGQEPERTNELLQCLALALDNNLSSDEAVKSYKETVKLNSSSNKKTRDAVSPVKKSSESRKINSKSSDKSIKNVKSDNNGTKSKNKEINNIKKETNSKKSSLPPKATKKVIEKVKQANTIKTSDDEIIRDSDNFEIKVDQNSSLDVLDDLDDADVTKEVNAEPDVNVNNEYLPSQESSKDEDKHEGTSKTENIIAEDNLTNHEYSTFGTEHVENKYENKEETIKSNNELEQSIPHQKTEVEIIQKSNENNSTTDHNIVQTHDKKVTDTSNIKTSDIKRPSSVRPSSSRPGAPRIREKHDNIITSVENLVGCKVNIIAEKTVNEEEDEPTIVIMDNTDNITSMQEENAHLQTSSDQHGHLVQQILNAQKEFTQAAGITEIEWQFGAQKARDVMHQEFEQIRFNVQALSRVANPLGKLLDHIQEDVEVMRQELQQWKMSYEHASKELQKQKAATEEYLLPLYARKKQLDVEIAEKQDKINDLKIIIHKNVSRIDKLLSSANI